jgi:hypothetical protein
MGSALILADWYVNEALRLQRGARTDPKLLAAQQLLDWLRARSEDEYSFRDLLQKGPNLLRTRAAMNEALATLTAHGWVLEVSRRPRRVRLVREG